MGEHFIAIVPRVVRSTLSLVGSWRRSTVVAAKTRQCVQTFLSVGRNLRVCGCDSQWL